MDPSNAETFRLWAAQCQAQADRAAWCRAERERLLRMRESLLA
jgi:hypothetical protein